MLSNPHERKAIAMPRETLDRESDRRRLYLARHGEVSYFPGGANVDPRTVPLNENGRAQARALGELLGESPLDRAISSGLPRTRETAELIVAGRELEVEPREDLQEIQPGSFEGRSFEDIRDAFLSALPREPGPDDRFFGGETFGAFFTRVTDCLRGILEEPWKQLLIVGHGAVNRVILVELLGSRRGFGGFEQDPGGLNIIDFDGAGTPTLRLVNHTPCQPAKSELRLTTMERLWEEFLESRERDGRERR